MQPALALRPWPALNQRSGLPRRSVAGGPCWRVRVNRPVIGPRARGPPARRHPTLRLQPSPRRTPPSLSMRATRRSRAALVALPSPASRPSTPRRLPSLQPRAGLDTARRRPDRSGSSCIGAQTCLRAAIDPPAYPESAPRRVPVARSARLRPVRSALSRLSAADQRSVRCDSAPNRPWAVHVAASPGHRQPPAPTRQGPPAPPTPAPRSVPGGATAGLGTYARACGVEFFRKKNTERESPRRRRPPAPAVSGARRRGRVGAARALTGEDRGSGGGQGTVPGC